MILIFRPAGCKEPVPERFSTSRDVANGPGGLDGTIFALPDVGRVGYYPDKQTWIEGEPFWWGSDDTPVNPQVLAKPEAVNGHYVTLEDGQRWLIPAVRVFPSGTALPETLMLGPGGELVSKALPRFAEVSADGELVYEFLLGNGELTQGEAWGIANRVLAVNYDVTPEYVSAAGLLTTRNIADVMQAMIDYPTIEAELKKKADTPLDTDNSSVGNAA